MAVGRKRKSNPLGLPDRCYAKHGQFWYVHRDDGRWEPLGTDAAAAKRKAALYNDPGGTWGTMAWYLDAFVVHCEKRVAQGALAERTHEDYKNAAEYLKAYFGKMAPAAVQPMHVGRYLDIGAESKRSVRANRERAALSACFTWLIRAGDAGVTLNPCRGVRRNTETPRSRYVDDAEFAAVYRIAHRSVRGAMGLVYRTLQRPGDVLKLGRADVVRKIAGGVEQRVLRLRQGKTGRTVEIAMTAELDAVLADLRGDRKDVASMTLVHTSKGQRYTEDGLASMLRRYCKKAGVTSFGLQDIKAKGATDMYQAGVPLEQIQALCGHDSVTTTEIYIKRHMTRVVSPNQVTIAGVGGV